MIDRPYQKLVFSGPDANGALLVTLSHPVKKNALGPQMVNELLYVLADAAEDSAVRTIVLTGAGNAFCAGGDFSQMAGNGTDSVLVPRGD